MTVAGNLALQSGAFYIVQVNPTTASTTNVSGAASLAGTVGAIFAPGSYMVEQLSYFDGHRRAHRHIRRPCYLGLGAPVFRPV